MNLYAPIIGLLALTAGFMAISILISTVLGPHRKNKAKYEMYECGVDGTPQPPGGGRIPIKYYLTAMLFIVFDIEIVFLYPWAVAYGSMGIFAVIEMMLFIATVFIAYVYVLRRGGLNWE
jgi:NADH-quinone oxidoreductase subunit A